jgi:Protein of unknown function (DUF3791)
MSNNHLTFTVFVLNKYALVKNENITDVYKHFNDLKIIDNYLIKHYDVLHTLGENYLLDDLTELIAKKSIIE